MTSVRGGFRAAVLMGAAASVLALASGVPAQSQKPNDSPSQSRSEWSNGNSSNDNSWPYATTGRSPLLAVVGDIACQPGETEPAGESKSELCINPKAPYTPTSLWQSQEATANLIETMKPDAVAIAGDLQYQVGQYSDFVQSFDLTYGAFKFLHRPAPGNHEFYDEHSETGVAGYGYFSYYNGFQIDTSGNPITTTVPDPCPATPADVAAACNNPGKTTPNPQPIPRADGQAGHFELGPNAGANGTGVADGWYSYNLGSWHLISLNIECSTQPGGCSNSGSWFAAELAWLKKDLDENQSACTLAYWHQPLFSATNGITPEGIASQAFWQLLYEHRADLVLNGHDHLYAHYRPLDPSGNPDPRNGIREFIVGTGGETLDPVVNTTVTAAQAAANPNLTETNSEDPSGNPNFNALNLETGTNGGFYWGVMALRLDDHGYRWHFKSALEAPLSGAPASTTFDDTGVGSCHNPFSR
jgi:acid phosphatase type 7